MQNLRSPSDTLLGLDGGDDRKSGRGSASATNDTLVELMRSRQTQRMAARAEERQRTLERLQQQQVTSSYLRQMNRRWRAGDVYAPHDLGPEEMAKFRKISRRKVDVLDALGLNPKDEYRVCMKAAVLSWRERG